MKIPVHTQAGCYEVILEAGSLSHADTCLNLRRKVLIVTDEGVPSAYAAKLASQCLSPFIVTVPGGESGKSIPVWESLLLTMQKENFTRYDCALAVGGGVVCDLTGFAAASYMRGIDFYPVPTTLLSQVDASVGCKTALNLGGIKNSIGAFYPPKTVLIDPDCLKTLPPEQIANGMAEVIKMAMTSDREFFETLEKKSFDWQNCSDIIRRALAVKIGIVEADEKETGRRRILNFGHTLGHAVESTVPSLPHGFCVALGMIPMCGEAVRPRLMALLRQYGLPLTCAGNPEEAYRALLHDKKRNGETVTVVLSDEPGTCFTKDLPPSELRKSLDLILTGGENET